MVFTGSGLWACGAWKGGEDGAGDFGNGAWGAASGVVGFEVDGCFLGWVVWERFGGDFGSWELFFSAMRYEALETLPSGSRDSLKKYRDF